MNIKSSFRLLAAGTVAILLSACATAPKPLQGQFQVISPRDAVVQPQVGAQVRWGGRIVKTQPRTDSTCFEMISAPLASNGRPQSDSQDETEGRFVACHTGFYDPAIFAKDREVTFVGRVAGTEVTRIGEYDYRLPKLDADVVYLWPKVSEITVRPYPSIYYHPYIGPYWGWGPFWGW